MIVKKFRLVLASDIDKEEEWLNELSRQGLQLVKFRWGVYYFEKDSNHSYVYQIDFNEGNDEYFQLYEDAGWKYVDHFINMFHYFRTEVGSEGLKKIYSDKESVKETYQRMFKFYLIIFMAMIVSQVGLFATWKGLPIQVFTLCIVSFVVVVYVCLFFALKRKIDYYQ